MDLDIEISKCKTIEEIEKLKDSKRIDLYQFILHLFIQQFYSIDLKSSVLSKEEWPVNRNESGDRRKSKVTIFRKKKTSLNFQFNAFVFF
jgi:hypothetical protein